MQFERICNENSPQFLIIITVEIMMAVDPDTAPYDAESSEDDHKEPDEIVGVPGWYLDTFDPLEPDVTG